MSWDIFVQDLPPDAQTVDQIPHSFVPAPIGNRSEIICKIKEIVPFADFTDPAWGEIETADYSIDINLGDKEVLMGFAFHVRGGDETVKIIADILDHLGLRGLESGEFFDRTRSLERYRSWKAYRNEVIESLDSITPPNKLC